MIFASSCPSCFAQASQNACGSLRTASSSALLCAWAPVANKKRRIPHEKCFIFHSSGILLTETNSEAPNGEKNYLLLERELFNFSLALGKICAYIRICRRVPSRRRNTLQRKGAQPAIFAWGERFSRSCSKPRCGETESKQEGSAK